MQGFLSSYAQIWKRAAPVTTTPPADLSAVEEALIGALGEAVSTAPDRLRAYVADTYWPALYAADAGAPIARPDVVVRPRSEEDVAAVLRLADAHGVPVVPWGGGSGTQGGALAIEGGIVIDMTSLDAIVEIDEVSLTVTAQAGVNGKRLEAELNARGLMLPHYPASVEWATVGGYIAARGSGVLSTRYGKIEDLLLSLRVATPADGLIETVGVPRHAVGPELTQLFVGSEGTLGVITRATLQLVPLPETRRFAAVAFPSVDAGIHAIRRALQAGHRPSVVRMYDDVATRLDVRARGRRGPARDLHRARLRGRGGGRRAGGAADARDRRRGRCRAARPRAGAALVGPPLRLLPPAPPARAARDLGHAGRRRHATTGSAPSTTRSSRRCASRMRTPGWSCGCTSRTGTCGAR